MNHSFFCKNFKSIMRLSVNSKIKEPLKLLEKSINEYMEIADVEYTSEDVKACMGLLNNHLDKVALSNSEEEGMQLVETTVLALNDLNEKCEYELIETDQREYICEIIIQAGAIMGYNDEFEDITEEWRDF